MASKKGKKSSARYYSERSKRGWETRRRNLREKKLAEQAREMGRLPKEKRGSQREKKLEKALQAALVREKAQKEQVKEFKRKERKRERIQKNLKLRQTLRPDHETFRRQEIVEDGVTWVNPLPLEWLHQDGTIAAQPTLMRHLVDTPKILRKMKKLIRREVKEHGMQANLYDLEEDFQEIADEYDVDVREIYTLYFSP